MRAVRAVAAVVSSALIVGGATLVAPTPAGADGITPVAVTCSGIPLVGDQRGTVDVSATDNVDPVVPGGTVVNTISVPVPIQDVPIEATITEVKMTIPVPTGVTVNAVGFTASSFANQTWSVSGNNLLLTFTGSVKIGGSNPAPTVPSLTVTTTVAGPPRVVSWRVPSVITARATWALGTINASCTPDAPTTVLLTTTVAEANTAPTATDASVSTKHGTPVAVTLAGTDPESSPLTFAVASAPSHGTLTGTAPALTYTPAAGFAGADAFTFTVSDGTLSDTGTISITVTNTAPVATSASAAAVTARPAAVTLAGTDADGDALTYAVTGAPTKGTLTGTAPNLTYRSNNGYQGADQITFTVSDGVATATGTIAITVAPWWAPWSSGTNAVTDLYTWFTGKAPTAAERTAALNSLNAGSSTIGGLVASLRRGTDATSNVDPTTRLYSAYFLRIPDVGGLNSWIGKRRTGRRLEVISSSFAASSEFKNRYGSLSNLEFVKLVYRNVLGREGDPAGINSWTKKLNDGVRTRGSVMVGFSESNEYKRGQVDKVDAAVVHIHLLGRSPSTADRDAFVTAATTGSLAAAVDGLLTHPALAARAR